MSIYLDNSATTKTCSQAIEAMLHYLQDEFYNPSSLYTPAMLVEKQINETKKTLLSSLKANSEQLYFTSCGTESNNLAILGYLETLREPGDVLYTAAEHSAVKNACEASVKRYGMQTGIIPLKQDGTLNLESLKNMLSLKTKLICVMHVSNETGVIMPLSEVVNLRNQYAPQAAIHVDGVQSYLRIPFDFSKSGIQSYAISGHKIHAPKGIGALFVRKNVKLAPQFFGGGQQENIRSGTENVPGIIALREAVLAYSLEASKHMLNLKLDLLSRLTTALPNATPLALPATHPDCASHILSIAFPPVRAETLLHALETHEIYVGTGSACASKKGKNSPVLTAMKLPNDLMESAIRISLCPENTLEEMAIVADAIIAQVTLLKRFHRR